VRADVARWHSLAANRFRERVDQVTASLHRTARTLDTVADQLDAHARTVRAVLDGIEHAPGAALHAGTRLLGSGLHELRRLV
jgi:uncharacterized protein YukE